MQRLVFAALTWLALAFSACGQTVQVPVTPNQLEYSNFVFAVAVTNATGGTAFHITITTKTQPIGAGCAAAVTAVNAGFKAPYVAGLTPPVQITFDRTDTVWTADFIASAEVANDPANFFIFVVPDYTTNQDGTRTYLSTDRIYEIRLQDFLPH